MGSHVVDAIETLTQDAARAASHSRLRKRDMADIIAQWRAVSSLLPQEARHDAVNDAIEQVEFHGPIVGRALCEAVARYALWYEGYSFGR